MKCLHSSAGLHLFFFFHLQPPDAGKSELTGVQSPFIGYFRFDPKSFPVSSNLAQPRFCKTTRWLGADWVCGSDNSGINFADKQDIFTLERFNKGAVDSLATCSREPLPRPQLEPQGHVHGGNRS